MDVASVDRILVGTDFSASSAKAVDLAADMARGMDADVVLLHVNEHPETAPLPVAAVQRRNRARDELARSRRQLEDGNVRVKALLRPGDPAREILRIATSHGAHVIVIGTHGATSTATLLLGSVADRVVRYAAIPVVVVPDVARRPAAIPSAPAAGRPPGTQGGTPTALAGNRSSTGDGAPTGNGSALAAREG
jgi:nucleotide-binding universal stress UspA family protein